MDISIHQQLKELASLKACVRAWGAKMAKVIFARLDQLQAATCLEDMKGLPGHCHELKEDRKGQLAIDLVQPYRLIFRPDGNPEDIYENNSLAWKKVTSIEVLEIKNYHD